MNVLRSLICLAALCSVAAAQTDLTVDATTRATTLNPHEGVVASLTDGVTLEDDENAASMMWGGVGLLVAEWDEPVHVAKVRIFLGLMERYGFYGYQGGGFTDTGTRIDVETPAYSREGLAPLDENIWWDLEADAQTAVDNVALSVVGTTVLYEIQFLGPDGTVIQPSSLGLLKAAVRDGR